jgi:hypothetical protein
VDDVATAARLAIYEARDGADWNMYDEDEEPTEDGLPAMLFSFDQLIRASQSQDRENLFYGRAAACRKYRPRGNSEVVEIREAPSNVLG